MLGRFFYFRPETTTNQVSEKFEVHRRPQVNEEPVFLSGNDRRAFFIFSKSQERIK